MSQGSFEKGSLGQQYIARHFAGKSVLYWTDEKTSHPFDGIALEWETYDIIAIEIKTKSARTWYRDTGFDLIQWERLQKARDKYNRNPFIVFVDEGGGLIYGNHLSILERPRAYVYGKDASLYNLRNKYPSIERDIVYFPLVAMKKIAKLSDEEVFDLRRLSNRNEAYEYPPDKWYEDLDQDAV